MWYQRMVIEKESPEEYGYDRIRYNFTESSVKDQTLAGAGIELSPDLLLCYGDHKGMPELREQIAVNYGLNREQVVVAVGACMAVFLVYNAILKPRDHIVTVHPNYPADIDIAESLGCQVDQYELRAEDGFRLDVKKLAAMIREETRLVSITLPHNPTGSMISEEDLRWLVRFCEEKDCYLLVDETYGDLTRGKRLSRAAALSRKAISVESISKALGVPGIRAGWLVTQDEALLEQIVAVKEQVCICGSVVDEACAYQVLRRKEELYAPIREDLEKKYQIVEAFLKKQEVFDWIKPAGGVVCFPTIRKEIELDPAEFYQVLNDKYGVFVGPGHWFGMDDRSFRLGFGWPSQQELKEGLPLLVKAVEDVRSH